MKYWTHKKGSQRPSISRPVVVEGVNTAGQGGVPYVELWSPSEQVWIVIELENAEDWKMLLGEVQKAGAHAERRHHVF